MSRIHHLVNAATKNASCGLQLKAGLRITGTPRETTCGECKQVLNKQYREETAPHRVSGEEAAGAITAARAWWNGHA